MVEDATLPNDSAPAVLRGSSPYATGGGGVTFERRVAATYMARLLAGLSSAEIGGARIVQRVAFQQGPGHPVDDIVVLAAADDDSVEVSVACRRRPEFVTSDDDTRKLVGDLLRALPAPTEGPKQRLVIAVAGYQANVTQVQELADLARSHDDHRKFFNALATPGRFRQELQSRLGHFEALVTYAFGDLTVKPVGLLMEGVVDVKFITWLVLTHLWVISPRLESPDETDWTHLADVLGPMSQTRDAAGGFGLLGVLESLAANYAPAGASVDSIMLRRALHSLLHRSALRTSRSWVQLSHLGEMLEATTRGAIGATNDGPLHLERQHEIEALRAALVSAPGALLVTGQSGAGKSRLVLDALASLTIESDDVEYVALSLRDLPATSVEFRAALDGDLRDALLVLTAPTRYLVVDAAEAVLEGRVELLNYVAMAARDTDVHLVVTSTSEGASTVRSLLEGIRIGTVERAVELLTNAEVDIIAVRFPWLAPLAAKPASRELLRRPVVADLLVRARADSHVLSEAAALEAIWKGLVRNDGRPSAGQSAARENVVRALARAALSTTANELALDDAAVTGLRTDGVLSARSAQPWEQLPAFAHDQLRTYAVAALLAGSDDFANALLEAGAPRWTLPAARTASQVRLEASASPAETFDRLQAQFDIVAEKHGDRWSDVPTEALLASKDPRAVLMAMWTKFVEDDAAGLDRILRLLEQRHRDGALLRVAAFAPVLDLLLGHGTPHRLWTKVTELTDDWLRSLLVRLEPAGDQLRMRLRQQVLDRIEDGIRQRDRLRLEEVLLLARRTPEKVRDDERREAELRKRPFVSPGGHSSHPAVVLAPEKTDEWVVRRVALLGPDAGPEGAELLSEVAEHSPQSLAPALETPGAPLGLTQLDPKLLATLTEAYYVEIEDEDNWDYGGGLLDDGIRDHTWSFGLPLAAYHRGPFIWLFRNNLVGGVRVLNRMLNHAARHRERDLHQDWAGEREHRHDLSISGEPQLYIGDEHVYQWHAGTGIGPYPCMSGLQAVEFVIKELLDQGVPLEAIVRLLLLECENVAMVALVVRLLAQRFAAAGTLLDPYLREPAIWRFEFRRAIAEMVGVRVRSHEQSDETRSWNFRDLSMRVGIAASNDSHRADQLRQVAIALVATDALSYAGQGLAEVELANRTAMVRGWAAMLDTDRYQWTQLEDGRTAVQFILPEDVTEILGDDDDQIARDQRALLLPQRYINRRNRTGRVSTDIPIEDILDDVAFAQDNQRSAKPTEKVDDGSAAVAGSVVATHANQPGAIPDDVVVWAIQTLLAAADAAADDSQYFSQGADRSAALGLPIVLTAPPVAGAPNMDEIEIALLRLARRSSVETRTYLAVALGRVFHHPCSTGSRCVHRLAYDLLVEGARRCVVGAWNQETLQRDPGVLEGPFEHALETLPSDQIAAEYLSPAIRGVTDAAVHPTCVADEARSLTECLLTHHARGLTEREHPAYHSSADALIAARAVLTLAWHGPPEPLEALLKAHASNERSLGEILQALGAVAEESEALASTLRSIWPSIIDLVLELIESGNLRPGRGYFEGASRSELIPYARTPDHAYLRRELHDEPVSWTDLDAWQAAINRWIPYALGRASCVDRLIWLADATLPAGEQASVVLPWVETIVHADPESVVSQSRSLAEWIRELRAVVTGTAEQTTWQALVDQVVLYGGPAAADLAD